MSLFGSIMGDYEEDPFFGAHMRQMRHMNNMMNSLFADPFGMMGGFGMGGMGPPALTAGSRNSMVPFGFPAMPMPQLNMNRLLSGSLDSVLPDAHSFSSSSMVSLSMTPGPDGRPQVVQSSSSTRTGPGGVRETKRTVSDSRSGTKKMAIGHHIGSRSHVIEREQNTRSGDQEERQEFINLDEEEAEDFNKEFAQRSRAFSRRHNAHGPLAITSGAPASSGSASNRRARLAMSAPQQLGGGQRTVRTSLPKSVPLSASSKSSPAHLSIHPYSGPSRPSARRPVRPMKSVSGSTPPAPDTTSPGN